MIDKFSLLVHKYFIPMCRTSSTQYSEHMRKLTNKMRRLTSEIQRAKRLNTKCYPPRPERDRGSDSHPP